MRKKLIKLIKRAITDWEHGDVSEKIADNLIANGVTMESYDCHWATETAYKNGYAKGYADAIVFARRELNSIGESISEIQETVKELLTAASRAAEGGK